MEQEEKEINWDNLADNKCPKCSLTLLQSDNHFNCTCEFSTHKDKFDKITKEFQNARLRKRDLVI